MHVRSYETYQPVWMKDRERGGTRECGTRWEAVCRTLDRHECRSMVDLGCSEGYYVLQAARHGLGFCVGVDFDLRRIWTCQNQVVLNDVAGAGFIVGAVSPTLIESMPGFDAVVFLSVLHHLMAAKGEAVARDILCALARKAGKVMIFEMGQSDERSEVWASRLPDMGADPHSWIADFVSSCGFRNVQKVAETPAYGRDVTRAVFECVPSGPR